MLERSFFNMSLLDSEETLLSKEGPAELYVKSVQWLQEHCGPDIIYEEGSDDKFKSYLINDPGSWTYTDGISSKVILKWNAEKYAYTIIPVNKHCYVYVKNDTEPGYLDFSKCDAVFVEDSGQRLRKDPETREVIFKTFYI